MKRLMFVFLIIVVLGVIGFYVFMEFSAPEISYVSDTEYTIATNEMVIRRLYTSGVDVDAFYKNMENTLISAEFSDEEILAAALASGTPEFFPAFYFSVFRPDATVNSFLFSGVHRQEVAPSQTNTNFMATDLFLEVSAEGFEIDEVEVTYRNPEENQNSAVPVISEDRQTMAINLADTVGLDFTLLGERGMLTFQYTYNVSTNNIFPSVAMADQLLMVYAEVEYTDEGELKINYIREPYSSLEDLGE